MGRGRRLRISTPQSLRNAIVVAIAKLPPDIQQERSRRGTDHAEGRGPRTNAIRLPFHLFKNIPGGSHCLQCDFGGQRPPARRAQNGGVRQHSFWQQAYSAANGRARASLSVTSAITPAISA